MSKLCYTLKHKQFTMQVKAASCEHACGVVIEVKSAKTGKSYTGKTSIPCFKGNIRKVRRLARLLKRKLTVKMG